MGEFDSRVGLKKIVQSLSSISQVVWDGKVAEVQTPGALFNKLQEFEQTTRESLTTNTVFTIKGTFSDFSDFHFDHHEYIIRDDGPPKMDCEESQLTGVRDQAIECERLPTYYRARHSTLKNIFRQMLRANKIGSKSKLANNLKQFCDKSRGPTNLFALARSSKHDKADVRAQMLNAMFQKMDKAVEVGSEAVENIFSNGLGKLPQWSSETAITL